MRLHTNTDYIPKLRLLYAAQGVLLDVDEDDEVYAVQEGNALDREGMEDHRWQILFMPRGNIIAPFYTDMGLVSDFQMQVDDTWYPIPMFSQIILREHKVAECRNMADVGRDDSFAVKMLHEQVNESTIITQWRQMIEEDMLRIRNAVVFGPAGRFDHSGYSPYGARRQEELINGN